MAAAGMVNVGQLARDRWGNDVVAIGFSSYVGSVIASAEWGAPTERMARSRASTGGARSASSTTPSARAGQPRADAPCAPL
jgi:erythromycin esterase-like protein